MGDELTQLQVGNLALANLAGEINVLQHSFQGSIVFLDSGQGFVQQIADVDVRFVDQVLEASTG